jgi:hypothetical protein
MHDVKETYHEKQGHLELVLLRYEKLPGITVTVTLFIRMTGIIG